MMTQMTQGAWIETTAPIKIMTASFGDRVALPGVERFLGNQSTHSTNQWLRDWLIDHRLTHGLPQGLVLRDRPGRQGLDKLAALQDLRRG